MDIFSCLTYPTEPHRICTCGMQPNGTFITECPNCHAWRIAQPIDAVGVRAPQNRASSEHALGKYRGTLNEAEDRLEDLLMLRDAAKSGGIKGTDLASACRAQRRKIHRLRQQIAHIEKLYGPYSDDQEIACQVS